MYRSIASACRLSTTGATRSVRRGCRLDFKIEARSCVQRSFLGSTSVIILPSKLPKSAASIRGLNTFNTPDENLPTGLAKFQVDGSPPPFTKLLAANRGEISCRISRAAAELGIMTAGIYSHEGK